jgi:hypothetical protein
MTKILKQLEEIVKVQSNFLAFLGPTLKALVSDFAGIDKIISKVIDLSLPIVKVGNDDAFSKFHNA